MTPDGEEAAGSERYRRIEVIGSGGMASVWRGLDTELDRPVAIKVISEGLAHDEDFMRRFAREARIAASLSHPGLVRVHDFEPDAERPFIVMELLEGGTLADALAAGTTIDAEALARQLLAALGHIHEAGIVHRDVKPANVLLDDAGDFRLTDFGIAMGEESTRYTRTGNVVGTLRYMAPEVKSGAAASPGSDLFSAGVVIGDAAGPAASGPIPVVIAALTTDDPAARPASAAAALALLDGGDDDSTLVLGAAPVGDPTAPTELIKARGRGPLPYVAAALAALATVAIATALLGGGDQPTATTDQTEDRPQTKTVTETTTSEAASEPVPAEPETNPAGRVPPGQAREIAPTSCEQLEQEKDALKDEGKAAEEAADEDKDAKEAVKDDYKAREEQLDEEIKACKEAEKAAG